MLKSFGVRNFRCLEDFEISNLSRVNLFVGDNNSGKTTLLEALFGHLTQANAIKFITLKGFRQRQISPDKNLWKDFFTGFDDSKEIHFWSVDHTGTEHRSKVTVGQEVQLGFDTQEPGMEERLPTRLFRPLQVEYSDESMAEPQKNEVIFDVKRRGFTQTQELAPSSLAYYFSSAGPPEARTVADHLSELLVRKQEKELVGLARVIDQRVQGLSVASPKGISEVFVDLGEPTLFPLSLLGSGVIRAIGIASAIPAYAGGLLLVDEIETGIYYKKLGGFFRYIYEMAKKYDVQVFGTSHSAEAVQSAIKSITADLKDSDPLHVYRLARGKRKPIPYERETLESASEFDAEFR